MKNEQIITMLINIMEQSNFQKWKQEYKEQQEKKKQERKELLKKKREEWKQENKELYKAQREVANLKAKQKRMQDKLDDLNNFLDNNKSNKILYI